MNTTLSGRVKQNFNNLSAAKEEINMRRGKS